MAREKILQNGIAMKMCSVCKILHPESDFHKKGDSWDGLRSECKKVEQQYKRNNRALHAIQERERTHRVGSSRPISEAKDSASYFGVFIGERILSNLFKNVIRMPYANRGFDFISEGGIRIDAKCSSLRYPKIGNPRWSFGINANKLTDYFLCMAFDSREKLQPMHIWLIPANKLNKKTSISIANSAESLATYAMFEQPLGETIPYCNQIRAELKKSWSARFPEAAPRGQSAPRPAQDEVPQGPHGRAAEGV